jgi:hypothetical protein
MIVVAKKEFSYGMGMTVIFFAILAIMFSPMFGNKNAFEAADDFFNAISKGSTYYMPSLAKQVEPWSGKLFDVALKFADQETAGRAGKLFTTAGANVSGEGAQLKVAGDLGKISAAALADSDAMFQNKGKEVADRYGFPEKEVLLGWWTAFKEMDKDLKRQKKFDEARWLGTLSKRGVEVGYNFYRIEAKKASAAAGMLALSLIFYVAYTMWWGYAVLFLCEGLGLQMKPGAKKEV